MLRYLNIMVSGTPIINDEDLVAINVKYPDFSVDGNTVKLGDKTYTFDTKGSVISVVSDNGIYSTIVSSTDVNAKDFSVPSPSDIASAIIGYLPTPGEIADAILGEIPSLDDILSAIKADLPSLGDVEDAILGPLESMLKSMVDGVKAFLKEHAEAVVSKFNSMIEFIQEFKAMVQETYNNIANYLKSLYIRAKSGIISAYEFVVDGVKYIFNALQKYTKLAARFVIKKVKQGIAMAKDYANKTIKYFHYLLYGAIIVVIIAIIVACVFRFTPVDLKIKYVK